MIYHALFHTGNGETSAGTHCWSADGVVWYGQDSTPAYTGRMEWAPDTDPVYAGKNTCLWARRAQCTASLIMVCVQVRQQSSSGVSDPSCYSLVKALKALATASRVCCSPLQRTAVSRW